MEEIDIFDKMNAITTDFQCNLLFGEDNEHSRLISEHRAKLQMIRRERPLTTTHYRVAVYIRYFNQTKHENYLAYHKKQFVDTLELCPNWEFVGFYIDEGQTAPNMENAPEWSRLLNDCFKGKVDLVITQKVSNVSRKMYEITMVARMLATQKHPVGIYFISEDIFTLASYYQDDMQDPCFLPNPSWTLLPEDSLDNYSLRRLPE